VSRRPQSRKSLSIGCYHCVLRPSLVGRASTRLRKNMWLSRYGWRMSTVALEQIPICTEPIDKFLPVPIVVASCASLSAFDTAAAAPALEHHRSDATHRELAHALHDDHHSSFRSQRLDHRGRCRIRAATPRDNNRPMQHKSYRDLRRSASDLNSSPMRTSRVSASRAEPADRTLRSPTIPIAAKPRIASRAFVQSGFNEVASQAPAAPSRERDLTEPSRFTNPRRVYSES
jgi:hypothetical protein